tara:strand:+ start:836 stop:1171 length:336 start_codon:yes stop_codon:yes gene_type:complete
MYDFGNDGAQMAREDQVEMERQKAFAIQSTEMQFRKKRIDANKHGSAVAYVIMGIVGMLLFWFFTSYVLASNPMLTGILVIALACTGLVMLRDNYVKDGTRSIYASSPMLS